LQRNRRATSIGEHDAVVGPCACRVVGERLGLDVHDDGRVGGGVAARSAGDREGVDPAAADEHRVFFAGHRGDLARETVDRLGHDGALCGGHLGLEQEPLSLVGPPPREPSILFDLRDLGSFRAAELVATPADRAGCHVVCPCKQRVFVAGRGESSQLDHLVDADLAGGERPRDRGQRPQRGARCDPTLGLPARDAELHRHPVRHVVRTVVEPGFVFLQLGDAVEHLALGS
jgi:hypothetical protein